MNTPTTPTPAPTYLGLDIARRALDLSVYPARAQRADASDALDAGVLAEYGRVFQPAPAEGRTPAQQRLGALVTRRQELLEISAQEQHRAEHRHDAFVIKKARSLTTTLRRHLEQLEEEIAALEKADAVLAGQVQRLTGIQGAGRRRPWPDWPPTTTTAARSAGSGTSRTDAPLARRPRYMAARVAARYNPILRPFYQRRRAAGKPAKAARVALLRKLAELANLLLKSSSFGRTLTP